MPDPDWLPALITLEEYGGDWNRYVEAVYEEFVTDFVASKPKYVGARFALKRHPTLRGKEATFWHITSEGSDEDEREPDLRRCERIRWPRVMIDAMGSENVRVWRQQRQQNQNVMIALPDFSYVIVLRDRGGYVMLWTAFPVENENDRRRREKEYLQFVDSAREKRG